MSKGKTQSSNEFHGIAKSHRPKEVHVHGACGILLLIQKVEMRCLLDFGRKTLAIFESTYIREAAFSRIKKKRSKIRLRMTDEYPSEFRSLQPLYLFQISENMLTTTFSAICCTHFVSAGTLLYTFRCIIIFSSLKQF